MGEIKCQEYAKHLGAIVNTLLPIDPQQLLTELMPKEWAKISQTAATTTLS